MTETFLATLELRGVELIGNAVVNQRGSCRDRQRVNQLQRFLSLNSCDDGRNGRSSRNLASLQIFAPQKRTTIPHIDQLVIDIGHTALVTGTVRRYEYFDNSIDFLNAAIDPRPRRFPTLAIHPQTSFTIVQTTNDGIDFVKQSEPNIRDDIAVKGFDLYVRVQIAHGLGGHFRFGPAAIPAPE